MKKRRRAAVIPFHEELRIVEAFPSDTRTRVAIPSRAAHQPVPRLLQTRGGVPSQHLPGLGKTVLHHPERMRGARLADECGGSWRFFRRRAALTISTWRESATGWPTTDSMNTTGIRTHLRG